MLKSIQLYFSMLFYFSIIFFSILNCKPKGKTSEEQILGTRYSRIDQFVFSKMGSQKKEDRVVLIYALEEINAKEISSFENKDYFKLTTVNGKEGFALASNFSEAVLFIVQSGLDAFRKPTLTAGTKGKLNPAAICFQKEVQAEWSNVDCLSANLNETKLEDWYDVWIQNKDEKISRDPLLGQTALEIREVYKLIPKLNIAQDEEKQKILNSISKIFNKSKERADIFSNIISEIEQKYGLIDSSQNQN